MNFPQICDVIIRSSATRLQINRRVFKMGRKSKELSEDRKQLVVDLKQEGHRNCEIVKLLHIPESTIHSIWKKYNSTGNVENIPRVGRPRKVTRRSEIRLLRTVKKNRGKIHPKTIQRYLHKNKIFRHVVSENGGQRGKQKGTTILVSGMTEMDC